jgi:radical SAM protein with 4Fe4S-binding SPASM domain
MDEGPTGGVAAGARRGVPPGLLQPELPLSLQVELTSHCNLRCVMCPLTTGTSSSSAVRGHIAPSTWEKILPVARRCGKVFLVGFGEPFTNPATLSYVAELDRAGVEVTISTNALSVTAEAARRLAALRNVVHVNVSLDTPDPDLYRAVRGGGLERALRGLRHLTLAFGEPSRISVSAVAMRKTFPSLARLPPLLAGIGVEKLEIQAMTDYNDFAAGERRLEPTFAATLEELTATCAAHGVQLLVTGEERIARDLDEPVRRGARPFDSRVGATPAAAAGNSTVTRQCAIPWEIPFVDKDGRVFPCCFAASQNVSELGCLRTSTFEEIWAGRPFERFRRALLEGARPPDVCRRCTLIPLGEHPFRRYAARLLTTPVVADRGRATVEVVNEGREAWERGDAVRLGTARPRDRSSQIRHASWLSPNRPAGFREARVLPGDVATFEFAVSHRSRAIEETFQLVVDGVCWLPGTHFTVTVPAAGAVSRAGLRVRRRRSGTSIRT